MGQWVHVRSALIKHEWVVWAKSSTDCTMELSVPFDLHASSQAIAVELSVPSEFSVASEFNTPS
jgi:hypothetical protein